MMGRCASALLLAGAVLAPSLAAQNGARPFAPLVADPKQPHFFATWLWITSPIVTGQVASVGLGEEIALARGHAHKWEVSVAAGVFSQFNMETRSNDLINTDFIIGFPFAYRTGLVSIRARIYHQSSHLGDEFILNTNPTRVNLSFEAAELLVARDVAGLRVYGGGEYIVRHEPSDLRPGLVHAGLEYRHGRRVVHLGGLGDGHAFVALDVKSAQERKWRVGWSGRAGVAFRLDTGDGSRLMSLQLQGYTGPAPYGQFYQKNVRSVGVGIHFEL
jgi:opacity protein-like surface antigen